MFAVPKQPSGVVAEHVDVGVPIHIVQPRLVARCKGEWKRCVREHRASVAAWQKVTGLVILFTTLWVAISKIAARFCQGVGEHATTLGRFEYSLYGSALGAVELVQVGVVRKVAHPLAVDGLALQDSPPHGFRLAVKRVGRLCIEHNPVFIGNFGIELKWPPT